MITPKDLAKVTMTPEKKAMAKNDYFAFYIGRPLSYILTIPFLYTNITPNTVSVISIIPLIIGFVLSCFAKTKLLLIITWLCFFLWNLLDGVDGNIARYKKQFSPMGSVFDAMAGYVAMIFSFFAWGIIAENNQGLIANYINIQRGTFIILGAMSGIFVIFPRFIMHKIISTCGNNESTSALKEKNNYGIIKIIGLNLISISGFVQVLMLTAVLFNWCDLFTIGYFVLNLLIMVASLIKMLRK